MPTTFMRFPGGKAKVVTLSYDDNVPQDIQLVQIMKQYGLKGSFNINSGQFTPEDTDRDVYKTGHRRMTVAQSVELHRNSGMEVACHGVTHPFLEQLPTSVCVQEVLQDRLELERIFGCFVRGMGYPFGTSNEAVVSVLKSCGIVYSRTTRSTRSFDMPENWLQLNPTCHHNDPQLMELARKFVEDRRHWRPMMFCLWGHSYEFADQDNWQVMEDFARYISNRDDVWYATTIEIYDYVQAYRQLVFSADGKKVYNPTNTELFIRTGNGHFSIAPGQTKQI